MMLTREQILALDDRKITEVEIPEWGTTVYVRPMSAGDRDRLESSQLLAREAGGGAVNIRGLIASRVVCDAEGNRLFRDEDAAPLADKSAKGLDRIFEAVMSSAVTAEDVDEMEGNSAAAPGGASSSASRSRSAKRSAK